MFINKYKTITGVFILLLFFRTHTATPQVPDTERTSSSCSSSRPWSSMTEILTPEPGSEGSEEESQIVIEVTETDTSQNATSQDESRQEG